MSLCFLLAAGLGTRLKPFTDVRPKPSLPFLNLPLIQYGFYLAKLGGCEDFLLNLHHLPEEIKRTANSLRPFAKTIDFSDETQKILGSGGALWKAKEQLNKEDFFLVANGDEVLLPKDDSVIAKLFDQARQKDSLCTLLTCDHPELLKSLKAVWVDEHRQVQGFGMESPRPGLRPVHYTGYKVFSRRIFDYLPEGESNIFYEVLTQAIRQGEVVSHLHLDQCHWHETGNFPSFLKASNQLIDEALPLIERRWQFFNQSNRVERSANSLVVFPRDWKSPRHLKVSGLLCVAPKVQIGEKVHLENVMTESAAEITAGSNVKNAFVFSHPRGLS